MNPLSEHIIASYRHCRRLCRNAQSNFSAAFSLISAPKRRAMEALYAFMRFTDDLADSSDASEASHDLATIEKISARLRYWRNRFELHLAASSSEASATLLKEVVSPSKVASGSKNARDPKNDSDKSLWEQGEAVLPALIDSIRRYRIPHDYFFAVFDGVEMDLSQNRYRTFDELMAYCERVASAVGLACIHIWGFKGRGTPEAEIALEASRQVGIAFQMTNILRDLREDLARNRVYLPLNDLHEAGYSVEELQRCEINPAFHRLMEREITRTQQFFQAGETLYDQLSREGRKIFGLMYSTYKTLLERIARRPEDVFAGRIRIGVLDQIRLFTRWLFHVSKILR